ncbi:hypothetical protein SAY86_014629 [Trapa natans]|uniref:Uncharacterized protein n=1 Tax=Trapa natans TaxID=22666 RepID=A0AAN7QGU9_TRANT|nr:hypothetical protein SAY86_014629 [Trapa natans]
MKMKPSLVSTPLTVSNARPDRMRKKRKARAHPQAQPRALPQAQWKTEAQQRAYSSKLLQALARARIRGGGTAVRQAADRALASAAKGKSRWSQAILTARGNRVKLQKQRSKRVQVGAAATGKGALPPRKARLSVMRLKKGRTRTSTEEQWKARVLGRLVPGCRKEPLPVILEEAFDYIEALEMQVKAMNTLALLLCGAGTSSNRPPL